MAERWTRAFLQRWTEKIGKEVREMMTGHFSFDFIYEEEEGLLYPIECNPVREPLHLLLLVD